MKSICFIGARGGSQGVPCKNIKKLAGKPLIAYAIESALDSKLFKHVVVSTENNEIARISKKFGAEVPFVRPKKLATNNSSMMDVITHGIKKLRSLDYEFDIFTIRDCTVPFIRKEDIIGTVKLLKKKNCNGVFGVYRQHLNPYFNMMETNPRGYLELSKKLNHRVNRRQDAPIVYQLNGLFTFKPEKLLKYNNTIMPKILSYEIPSETGLMIDTDLEFKFAEIILKNIQMNNSL
jgi:CMP-N,N'-diacetyllegionaminic acid synthase